MLWEIISETYIMIYKICYAYYNGTTMVSNQQTPSDYIRHTYMHFKEVVTLDFRRF